MRISDWSSDVCSSDLIASVAHVTLESRVRGAEGWQLVIDNRKVAGEGPAALPPGTRVRVERLFERVPARRKFLRTARSDYGACLDALRRLAMARPDIAFRLAPDGRRGFSVAAEIGRASLRGRRSP